MFRLYFNENTEFGNYYLTANFDAAPLALVAEGSYKIPALRQASRYNRSCFTSTLTSQTTLLSKIQYMKKSNNQIKAEDAIVDVLVDILTTNHGQNYTYEGFINETIEIYAFSKSKETTGYCILRIAVLNELKQIYIPNIFMPEFLNHQRIGKKLIRIIFELGQLYNYEIFVVDLTDSFRERLLKRGAVETNKFDILQIVEATNLLENQD